MIGEVPPVGDLAAVALDVQPRIVILANCINAEEVLRLRGAFPNVRIVVLTEPDGEYILAGIRCAVSGFLERARLDEQLIQAILQPASGQVL